VSGRGWSLEVWGVRAAVEGVGGIWGDVDGDVSGIDGYVD
jgi:hypothetical protein